MLRVAPWVVSGVVSNRIAGHRRRPPCGAKYVVGRGDHVQDLVRAVEIIPAPPREKKVQLSHLARVRGALINTLRYLLRGRS